MLSCVRDSSFNAQPQAPGFQSTGKTRGCRRLRLGVKRFTQGDRSKKPSSPGENCSALTDHESIIGKVPTSGVLSPA